MAGRLPTPQDSYLNPGETNLRKVVDAINSVSQQAFAPFTVIAKGSNASQNIIADSLTKVDVTGLSLDLVVPVPSRAIIRFSSWCKALFVQPAEGLVLRVARNGTEIADSTAVWEAEGVDGQNTFGAICIQEDLVPETVYTYTLKSWIQNRTTSQYIVVGTQTNLVITVEGRQRI